MEACPKCNFALTPEAVECPACGVILAKLKAASGLQRPVRPAPPPLPSPSPPSSPSPVAPLPVAQANPYAPPAAPVEGASVPPPLPAPPMPVPAQDVITRPTLAALEEARPWLRFLVIYGFIMISIMLVAAFGLLIFGLDRPEMMPLSLFYFLYGGLGFALLAPLHRSSEAIARLSSLGASASLESFATEQSSFWRRTGLICVVFLVLLGLGIIGAVLAALSQ